MILTRTDSIVGWGESLIGGVKDRLGEKRDNGRKAASTATNSSQEFCCKVEQRMGSGGSGLDFKYGPY